MTPRRPGRFGQLLAALVGFFCAVPFLIDRPGFLRLLAALFAAVLIAVLWSVGRLSRGRLAVALALGVPALVVRAVQASAPQLDQPLFPALTAAFLTYALAEILAEVLRPAPVDRDKIAGAVSVYLLLGLVWANLYSLVALAVPGSFVLPAGVDPAAGFLTFLYYSFVTLTTLGYGDVTPMLPLARTLSWMEAALGQLYLAVTIAALVGLRVSASHRTGGRPDPPS